MSRVVTLLVSRYAVTSDLRYRMLWPTRVQGMPTLRARSLASRPGEVFSSLANWFAVNSSSGTRYSYSVFGRASTTPVSGMGVAVTVGAKAPGRKSTRWGCPGVLHVRLNRTPPVARVANGDGVCITRCVCTVLPCDYVMAAYTLGSFLAPIYAGRGPDGPV